MKVYDSMGVIKFKIENNIEDYDLIIIPTNRFMSPGNKFTSVIYPLMGYSLLKDYCQANSLGNMSPMDIRITPGFNLNLEVVHVCMPSPSLEELLKTYIRIYELILKESYKKVAFFSFAGLSSYQDEDIYQDIMKLTNKFNKTYDGEITFIFGNQEIADMYERFYKILQW